MILTLLLLLLLLPLIFIVSRFLYINWGTHLQMVSYRKTERTTFNKFLSMYNQIDFKKDHRFPSSLFNHENDSSLHADMIKFEGKYYTLGALDFLRYSIWKKREIGFYEAEETFLS